MLKSNTYPAGYYDADTCRLEEFEELVSREVFADEIPHAIGAPKHVPVYDAFQLKNT